ncbi:hypothetical protein PACILC2_39140 [Paenibacillus cisolokensis]|uniref:Uncharacterized protein n=1 Tax=Paenibacillus cisolokensis TaxID=1658519 RepID=A0ABQ4NAV3_9BACL|nr:hypothetical protein [Paenibacillus cisolokensis]GIQ65346.1 hypothetical protein PACILC2_39140 [Paenibacillus cisolokensis]
MDTNAGFFVEVFYIDRRFGRILLYREMNQLTAAETADEGQTDEEDFAAEAGGATGS